LQVREITSDGREQWNQFVAWHKEGDLLQSVEWGDLKQASGGWQPIRLAVEEGGQIVGAISILKRKLPKMKKCIFYAPRGPVCDFSNRKVLSMLIDAVKERARREGAILLKIDPPVLLENQDVAKALIEMGFVQSADGDGFGGVQPRCVMQLNLTPSLEDVLAACKPKWRYNIRLAERKGVTVRSDCTKDDLRIFYNILLETATRDKFLVRDISYYDKMWDMLVPQGYMKLFLTEYEGKPIAGAISYLFGDKCWYTYGASSNQYRNVMPNHLMQWRMIEWAKESGCVWYDFRGVSQNREQSSDDHLSGLNRFKEGFGAKFVEYIGEFDLPLSPAWYWAWTVGKPKISAFLKLLRRRNKKRGASGDL
jgi:peptidoglycan pentaglycine glycine transferase (the first glycine)